MHPVGFEPTISASAWPQTYALDGGATGIGELDGEGSYSVDESVCCTELVLSFQNLNFVAF
jgi:hypothetical protein